MENPCDACGCSNPVGSLVCINCGKQQTVETALTVASVLPARKWFSPIVEFGSVAVPSVLIVLIIIFVSDSESKKQKAEADAQAQVAQAQAQSIALAEQQNRDERVKADAAKAAQVQAQIEAMRSDKSCHSNMAVLVFKNTADTRDQYATKLAESLGQTGIYAKAAGVDNSYLLFTGTPQSAESLKELYTETTGSADTRFRFCTEGFAEVQFIVRSEDLSQTLIGSYKTSFEEAYNHSMQLAGGTPVQ